MKRFLFFSLAVFFFSSSEIMKKLVSKNGVLRKDYNVRVDNFSYIFSSHDIKFDISVLGGK
jgi:hypothetical protein